MARLNAAHKTFIVQRLACFDTPSVVAGSVKEEFGVEVSRQAVEAYDPTKHQGRNLAKKYKELFEQTREAFLEDTSGIAISHKAVRLRTLQRMLEKAENMGNLVLARELLEQAAKESGDSYSNKRKHELSGPNGKPIETKTTTIDPSQLSNAALKELRNARSAQSDQ